MKNKIKKQKIYTPIFTTLAVFLLLILSFPAKSFAASISASTGDDAYAKDTIIINVFLDTEGENINTIDGGIILSDTNGNDFKVKDLSLVDSAFTVWPRKPSLVSGGDKITFIGGIPNGTKGNNLLLFKIIATVNQAGNFSVMPSKTLAYLNDGLGTSRSVTKNYSTIKILGARKESVDKWDDVIFNDNVPPEPFKINLYKDPELYDGNKFISFETTDGQSGVSYYTVKEGDNPPVRTGTNYILNDQKNPVKIVVTAYDKAGNAQIATFTEKKPIHWLTVILSVLIIFFGYKIFKKVRKSKRK